MIQVNVKKALTNPGSQPFNLEVDFRAANELTVLFGFSGAGKSLTLQTIAGLLKPDHGHIQVNGQVFYDSRTKVNLSPQQRRVGYVFQNYTLFPHMTVSENIAIGLKGLPTPEKQGRVKSMLSTFYLEGLGQRYPQQLSGGQQQRAAMARALVRQPQLILLDEPFGALDGPVRERLRRNLLQFSRDYQKAILMVTHDLTEAFSLGDKLVVFDRGRVCQNGSPKEVFYHPMTRQIARLVGTKNIFDGKVIGFDHERSETIISSPGFNALRAPLQKHLHTGQTVQWCIRPELIQVLKEKHTSSEIKENLYKGKVVELISKSTTTIAFVNWSSDQYNVEIELPSHITQRLNLTSGKIITISLRKAGIHIIPQ